MSEKPADPFGGYADAEALINDARVIRLDSEDLAEPMVNCDNGPVAAPHRVRESVAARLEVTQTLLPAGFQIRLREGWRSIRVQRIIWENHLEHLSAAHPLLPAAALRAETARFVAPPDSAPPHSTGGAVDVDLVFDGEPVDMGWGFDEPGWGSATRAELGEPAGANRSRLILAMHGAGFVNYPQEWWHWSHGDRYWAFQSRLPLALFAPR